MKVFYGRNYIKKNAPGKIPKVFKFRKEIIRLYLKVTTNVCIATHIIKFLLLPSSGSKKTLYTNFEFIPHAIIQIQILNL